MADILKTIEEELPKATVSSANFEGANIVIYTSDTAFFKNGDMKIKEIVNKIKKRVELRADEKLLMSQEKTEETIKNKIPKEAEITQIIFDIQRSIIVIEAKKPGLAIGKAGSILKEIKKETFWTPQVQRSSAIKSNITNNIRAVLYANNNYRKKFLNSIGKKIYKEWNPEKIEEWIRLTALGGGRQVGRSCFLLQTPNSKILIDCGVDVSSNGAEKFPYLNAPEFDINGIDAIVVSHSHLDHCLPPSFPVLTDKGYKRINDIIIGDSIISIDWKTGKYIKSKCTEKTKTIGHKKVLDIKTPYSSIESSPNHRFFTFKNLKLKEIEASELKEGMLLPSNLLNKPKFHGEKIELDTNVEYDKRRKDKVSLPSELTKELSEFIAYYMGDGHKSTEFSLRITDSSLQILNHHRELLRNLFNHNAVIRHHSDKTKNAHVLELNNIKIIRFLEKNFPKAFLKTREITIPQKIKDAPPEIQKAFLKGFADAEGSVTNIIKICSFSKKMLEDLQYLFSLQGIPSNIKKDNTICLNSNFSINQFYKKIGFSLNYKQEKLKNLTKNEGFDKQDLMPLTPDDLKEILKQAGMFGRIHNSSNLSKLLPMCLLDLFRRKEGYATRKTVVKLVSFLEERLAILNSTYSNANLYALRQLLSITRAEASISTGLKIHQIQQIEENKTLPENFVILLESFIKEKLLVIICQLEHNLNILQNLLSLNVLWEKITKIEEKENPYPYLVDIEVENRNFIAGNIIVHNSGLIPYLYKMGYKGPVYMTPPTRDISALLALDFIGVAYKQAAAPLFSSVDIKNMVKHSICLNYNEVTDITPDIRITMYNAGHTLGSAMIHFNIGNGLHNYVYTGDMKFGRSRLLDSAISHFPRLETLQIESTYGGKDNNYPSRKESEDQLIEFVNKIVSGGGKVLLPELGTGHAQEKMLILEDAMKNKKIPNVPIYIDGMIWDINAVHTTYPDFLSNSVRSLIFADKNPFTSDIFKQVGSAQERKQVIEGGPCIILATSGMLVGGASVEYLKEFADSPINGLCLSCYQPPGGLGRQLQEGTLKEARFQVNGKEEIVPIKLQFLSIEGFSGHSSRNELLAFVNNVSPKPRKIIINHGEQSRSLDLASSLYKMQRVETIVPKNLETIRLR